MTSPAAGAALGRLGRYGPPIGWMAVIALLSGDLLGAEQTGAWLLPALERLLPGADPSFLHGLHGAIRKLGHVVEYGILAALWRRALAPRASAGAAAVGLTALYAVLDEARQGLARSRTPSALDVAIDAAGAVLAIACLEGGRTWARVGLALARGAVVALAAASLAAGALDWSLGLDARGPAATALGAAVGAFALHRLAARAGRPL